MHYHLTQQQRIELSLLMRIGHTQRNAALVLGVSPSTVSRELARNRRANGQYHATMARLTSSARRKVANGLRTKLLANPELANVVERRLKRNDSPEQIAGWLRDTRATLRVTVQTIYDWVYLHARHLLKHLHCRKGKYLPMAFIHRLNYCGLKGGISGDGHAVVLWRFCILYGLIRRGQEFSSRGIVKGGGHAHNHPGMAAIGHN